MRFPGLNGFITCSICIIASLSSEAQLSSEDSTSFQQSLTNTINLFHASLGDQTGLYNGRQYAGYPFRFAEGHPFFSTDSAMVGTVVYDDILYPVSSLQYDELSGVLVMRDAHHLIELLSPRISAFSLLDHRFIRLITDSGSAGDLTTGFYEVLYDGRFKVLKREVKSFQEVIKSNAEGVSRYIEVKTRFYIQRQEKYYPVKNKNSVFAVFQDHKNELRQFAKTNKLNASKNWEEFLVSVSAYYDQLTR